MSDYSNLKNENKRLLARIAELEGGKKAPEKAHLTKTPKPAKTPRK